MSDTREFRGTYQLVQRRGLIGSTFSPSTGVVGSPGDVIAEMTNVFTMNNAVRNMLEIKGSVRMNCSVDNGRVATAFFVDGIEVAPVGSTERRISVAGAGGFGIAQMTTFVELPPGTLAPGPHTITWNYWVFAAGRVATAIGNSRFFVLKEWAPTE